MALVLKDRVKVTTTTTGTGTLTLGSAEAGFQDFSVIGDGNSTYYTIQDPTTGAWEVGVGVYTASGTTLSRNVVLSSSNSGSLVDFAAGSKIVFVTYPAEKAVVTDGAQTLTNKTISADNNTISGIAASSFVVSNAVGSIDGTAAQKVIPTGDVVGTSDSQALTNKTIAFGSNTLTDVASTNTTQTLTNKTLTDPAIIGAITEDIFTITDGAAFEIDPGNGTIQLITLGASRTPKATNFTAGESVTLMVDDGSAYTLTWTDTTFGASGVIWKTDGGNAPTLNTTGYTVITFWKVGTQVYGARVGNA